MFANRSIGAAATAALAGGLVLAAAPAADADPRNFSFVYETTTMSPGDWEYEQYVTWKTDKESDPGFDRLDFRHAIEFGVTDRFQLALYVSDWRYENGASVDDGAEWRNVAIEGIYNLSSPTVDPIGSALYGEVAVGDEYFELEGKILLQKYFGQVNAAYNAIIEAEWEGSSFGEDNGEFAQTFGLSYELSPEFALGLELLHEIEFPDWSSQEDDLVYFGPNAAYRGDDWWVTVTPLFQVTDEDDAADFQVRMLFGIHF